MARTITDLATATSLARVIASDLSLYHEPAIAKGLRDGRPFAGLEEELLEARLLFLRRVVAPLEPVPLLVRTLAEFFARWAAARGLPADGLSEALAVRVARAAEPLLLVVTGGGSALDRSIRLGDGVHVIGRVPEAEIQVLVDSVSRRHAKLVVDGPRVEVEDLESASGTFVDGAKVRAAPLAVGARLELGGVVLALVRAAEPAQGAHPPYDVLTRTLHREGVLDALAEASERGGPLAVAVCDVDHLARINDQYGQAVGDEVLRVVAARLAAAVQAQQGAAIGRYTGGSFLVVLPGIDARVLDHAEALRVLVAQEPITTREGSIQASISIGVTVRPGAATLTPATLVDRAWAACTSAKRAGRNGIASA